MGDDRKPLIEVPAAMAWFFLRFSSAAFAAMRATSDGFRGPRVLEAVLEVVLEVRLSGRLEP